MSPIEYKLSYTASEIDDKLGMIDDIQIQVSDIVEQLSQSGNSGATEEQIQQIEKNKNDIVNINSQLEQNTEDIETLTGRVDNLSNPTGGSGATTEQAAQIQQNKEDIESLSTTVNQNSKDISALKQTGISDVKIAQIDTNKTDISNLTNRVSTNETNISDLTTRVNNIADQSGNIGATEEQAAQINQNKTDISNLSTRVGNNEKDISALKQTGITTEKITQIGTNQTNISDLTTRVKTIEDTGVTTESVTQIGTNKTDISNLTSRVKTIEDTGITTAKITQIDTNKTNISLLTTRVSTLENLSSDSDGSDSAIFTGSTVSEIVTFLNSLSSNGITTAIFNGTYTINAKITIPAGVTIIGGTFVADANWEEFNDSGKPTHAFMFSAGGDNVRIIGATLKASSHNKAPCIYVENYEKDKRSYTGKYSSNVAGIYSDGKNGVALINCVCDKIVPAKINNGSGIIHGCTVIDTPMFVWATNSKMHISDNDVSICNTKLDYYYHVYYLDRNSELYANNNRITCDATTAFFDVYHLMTAENTGTYHASGIVEGDIIIGNFQYIIDCHYADLALKNCYIKNTNTSSWSEFSNHAYSTFSYRGCELVYDGATSQSLDSSINTPVEYHDCQIQRSKSLSRRCRFNNCMIKQTLASESALSNLSDVYNCEFHIYGSSTGIAVSSSGNFTFNVVGNVFVFEDSSHTNDCVMKCTSSTGVICNNVVIGANNENFWKDGTEMGTCANNTVKIK